MVGSWGWDKLKKTSWELGWLGYLVRGQEGEMLEDKKHEVGSKRLKPRGWAENENLFITCKMK